MSNKLRFSGLFDARSIVLAAALFFAFGWLYGITSEHLSHAAFDKNDAFFDADTRDTTYAMSWLSFQGDMRKHLLFSPIVSTLVRVINKVSGIGVKQSVLITISGFAALNVALCFLLLRIALGTELLAVAYATLYGVFLANLVIFSVPETYSVSNLFILVYVGYLLPRWRRLSLSDGTFLAVIAGVASLLNPPLLSLIAIHTFIAWRMVSILFAVRVGITGGLLGVFIYFGSAFAIRGPSFFMYSTEYLDRWASLGHFFEWQSVLQVAASFLAFAVVSPVQVIEGNFEVGDIIGYASTPLGLITVLAWLGLVAFSTGKSIRDSDVFLQALLVWIALLAIFYLYFNPSGAILYSPQILVPLTLVVATQGSGTFSVWKLVVPVVLAVLCGYQNLQAVLAAPTG